MHPSELLNGENSFCMIAVSNKDKSGIDLLIDEIIYVSNNRTLCPYVNKTIPKIWFDCEQYCKNAVPANPSCPVIKFQELLEHFPGFKSQKELVLALEYINSVGSIFYFHSIRPINDVIFLTPDWLIKLLKTIFIHNASDVFMYEKRYLDQLKVMETVYKAQRDKLLSTAYMGKQLLR